MEVLHPRDAADVAEAIAAAVSRRKPLEVVGGGSRRQLGRPVAAEAVLDLSALSGVVLYEPNELVLTARAATPLSEIVPLLAAENQHLAFEPPDFGPLWGAPAGGGTLGGAISVGFGGPRRPSAGGPRDHFLGFKAVNGFAEAFAAGGRVVKNVTGYDLPKLLAGAFGTLGVLTEVTIKVLPAPAEALTLLLAGLHEAAGLQVLRDAATRSSALSAAAFLPADVVARTEAAGAVTDKSATLIRLEGVEPAVRAAAAELVAQFRPQGAHAEVLDGPLTARLWPAIGGAQAFAGSDLPVWRVCAPPGSAAALAEGLRAAGASALYFDWGGGSLWVEGPDAPDGGAQAIRSTLDRIAGEGHATLVRAAEAVRATAAPFQPRPPTLSRLELNLKRQFDPFGVLNPGRMSEAH
ncbi:MAG: hypothetical protein JWQ97_2123 [Phenylobacterium sp.]|nr:hypothetical protein [Phenylobacterium sp.]